MQEVKEGDSTGFHQNNFIKGNITLLRRNVSSFLVYVRNNTEQSLQAYSL